MKLIKKSRCLLAAALCMAAVVMLAGCAPADPSDNQPDKPVIGSGEQVESPDDTPDASDAPSEADKDEPPAPRYINKLTGLETTEELASIRPVAVMINNLYQATPQQGISRADVMYEVLAEGGITRLLCLFTDYASLPETGSIRSSRDYFIDLSDAHDAIYVHCGGSPAAYETLAARKTDNMDGITFNTPFYRNEWRKKNMGMEHSMMTTGERLVKGISEKGYRTQSDAAQPLSFQDTETPAANSGLTVTATAAENITIEFSYYATSEFAYDKEAGVYLKSQFDAPHIDSNNDEQLYFENVILLYAAQGAVPNDDKGRLYVNFIGEGDGLYAADGKVRNIKWSKQTRTSSYTLYEEDGVTELLLHPGKTYIGIPPLGAETVIE